LYGRLFYIPDPARNQGINGDPHRTEPYRFPTVKSLMARQRALLINLGKQVSKITSRVVPPQPATNNRTIPSPPISSPRGIQLAASQKSGLNSAIDLPLPENVPTVVVERPNNNTVTPTIDPISAASQALQPIIIAPTYPSISAAGNRNHCLLAVRLFNTRQKGQQQVKALLKSLDVPLNRFTRPVCMVTDFSSFIYCFDS
jgi:hypothetical protein